MDMETKQGLLGWVIIAVGFGTVYAFIKYPTQVLKGIAISGMMALILVTILAARQERKYLEIREDKFATRYLEAVELAEYLSNRPDYMSDDFIKQWLHQWYSPIRSF